MKKEIENVSEEKLSKIETRILLLMSCIIPGFVGFIYEIIFYYFNNNMTEIYWRGANFIPWLDIYAIGSIGIFYICYKNREKPLKVFLQSMLITGTTEFLGGLLIYILKDGYRAWNYNTEILNFGSIYGFICLRSVLLFGVGGLMIIYFIIPATKKLMEKVNKEFLYKFLVVFMTILLIDEVYNMFIVHITPLPASYEIYEKLGMKYWDSNK